MSKRSSAALVTAEAPTVSEATPTLSEYQAIEQRLADGLRELERETTERHASLATIAARLAAIPGERTGAAAHVAALQQEQFMLPRRIQAARALVLGASSGAAEAQAKERLDTLLARQQ